jgi:hypothetical protein
MRRYLLCMLAIALTGVGAAAAWSWHLGPVRGDLTRVGGWPERDFGPRRHTETVALAPTRLHGTPDVVIVGDSFSLSGVWQPAALGATASYATYDIEHFCFDQYLASAAFRDAPPRVVVVQTVERLYLRRFGAASWCPRHSERAVMADPAHWKGYRAPDSHDEPAIAPGFALDALRARWREWQSPEVALSGESMLAGLTRTSLFSNRRADRILLCAGDQDKAHWTPDQLRASVANVLALQQRVEMRGRTTFVFMLVPDKSTAYRRDLATPALATDHRLGERLAAAGVSGPRIDRVLAAAIAAGAQDVYLPNDTHLSSAGFGLMADALRHESLARDRRLAVLAAGSDHFPSLGGS